MARVGKIKDRLKKRQAQAKSNAVATTEENVKITNSTVAEHREAVLGQARKFRYPLARSRHRIVLISLWLAVVGVLVVVFYSFFLLYKQHSTSKYVYQFSNVIPTPVARVDGSFVSYESYLFELRHVLHYKQTQENLDLGSEDGQSQLKGLREQLLDKVINDHYIDKLAKQNGLVVSGKDIDDEIKLLQDQQQLGADRSVLDNVLKRYYDWTYDDFRRSIHDQLLRQKYLSFLEKDKLTKAQGLSQQAKDGADFAALAKDNSDDDSTKNNGGTLPPLTKERRDAPLNLINAAFMLKAGEVSGPIETPYGIEILKVTENDGKQVKAQHIVLKYRNLDEVMKQKRDQDHIKVHKYIKV